MKNKELLKIISGIQTISSIMEALNVDRRRAVYYVHKLRKKGYVKTKYASDKKRIYYISAENALGGQSYVDIINKYSPIKISSSEIYKIYGREVSIEETLVYAVKSRSFRFILASLALFRKPINWKELYRLAKKNNLLREIGALYDLARKNIKKVRRMNKNFRNYSLPKNKEGYLSIIPNLKSSDFKKIEETWRVYLPFNEADLGDYKK